MSRREEAGFFLRFCIVGTIGFVVDAGLLQAGIHLLGLGPVAARVPSFLAAVLVTWYFNRCFTFRAHDRTFWSSFPTYIAANSFGMALNFGIYSAGVLFVPLLAAYPLLALAIGVGVSLFFNFAAARFLIFRKK